MFAKVRTKLSYTFAVTLLMLCVACVAAAQSTVGTGGITGTVTDPTGAVISNAKVTITNEGTGQTITATTNSAGAYNAAALAPGNYKLQISASGFNSVTTTINV